jgi:hypothetical protein
MDYGITDLLNIGFLKEKFDNILFFQKSKLFHKKKEFPINFL